MFFCSYNKGQVQITRQDYENVIVIFRKKNAENKLEIVCLGTLITKKWILVSVTCNNMLKPHSEVTASIGSSSQTLDIFGYQEVRPRSQFTILVVSSFTLLSKFESVKIY